MVSPSPAAVASQQTDVLALILAKLETSSQFQTDVSERIARMEKAQETGRGAAGDEEKAEEKEKEVLVPTTLSESMRTGVGGQGVEGERVGADFAREALSAFQAVARRNRSGDESRLINSREIRDFLSLTQSQRQQLVALCGMELGRYIAVRDSQAHARVSDITTCTRELVSTFASIKINGEVTATAKLTVEAVLRKHLARTTSFSAYADLMTKAIARIRIQAKKIGGQRSSAVFTIYDVLYATLERHLAFVTFICSHYTSWGQVLRYLISGYWHEFLGAGETPARLAEFLTDRTVPMAGYDYTQMESPLETLSIYTIRAYDEKEGVDLDSAARCTMAGAAGAAGAADKMALSNLSTFQASIKTWIMRTDLALHKANEVL